jgi:hypothetical protein
MLGREGGDAYYGAVQKKDGLQCFTDGCTGCIKLAMELESEAGIDTHRRELLRLPEQARKPAERLQQQEVPEQRRGRRRCHAQKSPEPGAHLTWCHKTCHMSQPAMPRLSAALLCGCTSWIGR